MPKANLYNMAGEQVGEVELSEAVFGIEPNEIVLHAAIKNHLANCRQGTQSALTKGEVSYTTAKPWRQKGTGRARAGYKGSPVWTHGGVAFAPKPRSYRYTMNRKEKRIALKSALSVKAAESKIFVVDGLSFDEIKTKACVSLLEKLGAENAMIMKRVICLLRRHWPQTHILLRGDGHFANPELMALIQADSHADFLFGLGGNQVLARQAEGLMKNARGHLALHQSLATRGLGPVVAAVRHFGEFEYAAGSWPQAFRVVVKAEVLAGSDVMSAKDNQRYVVTSLRRASPQALYQQEYCARGQAENLIKQVKVDLKSDRTSASSFLANFARLLFTASAYVLHQQLRHLGLQGTALASAQPRTVMLSLFKIAARVKQYKDRVLLHLPSACPVKDLLVLVCQRLYPSKRMHPMPASP